METINWEDIYVQLYAYTHQLMKVHTWFRGAKTSSFLKGKQVHDYVAEAIEKYLTSPDKYDPAYGRSLINYLKLHIIRTLVNNDAKSAENTTSSKLLSYTNFDQDEEAFQFKELLPSCSALFDQEIDFNLILTEVNTALQRDEIAKLIFENIRRDGLKRRDVIKQYNLTNADFDNGMKRLNTILKQIAKQFQLEAGYE